MQSCGHDAGYLRLSELAQDEIHLKDAMSRTLPCSVEENFLELHKGLY